MEKKPGPVRNTEQKPAWEEHRGRGSSLGPGYGASQRASLRDAGHGREGQGGGAGDRGNLLRFVIPKGLVRAYRHRRRRVTRKQARSELVAGKEIGGVRTWLLVTDRQTAE